jgi:O-methyltransferase
VDFTVYPKSRIGRLPRVLRPPALLMRNLVRRRPRYTYEADGLATVHFSPFLEDREFDELYWRVERDWFPTWHADLRWRMWVLTRLARRCSGLGGSFAEFGVYRGGTAYLTLATAALPPGRRFYLFDTFSGIPSEDLTAAESRNGLGGELADTSRAYVERLLDPWRSVIEIQEGNVLETLPNMETGPLGYVHLDLNASSPTRAALEYVYPRLLAGASVVFDDYGWEKYADQRGVVDGFFDDKPEEPIALPTGQAFLIAAPRRR